jgi:hypothetical protein
VFQEEQYILGGDSLDKAEYTSSYKRVQFSMGMEIQLFEAGAYKP